MTEQNKEGRPTKYDPKFIKLGYKYAEGGWEKLKHNHPSVIGFARSLRVSRSTLYNWADEYPEFLDTLEHIKSEQEFQVLDKSVVGEYVPVISKLILHNHGYTDKAQTDHVSTDGSISISWED